MIPLRLVQSGTDWSGLGAVEGKERSNSSSQLCGRCTHANVCVCVCVVCVCVCVCVCVGEKEGKGGACVFWSSYLSQKAVGQTRVPLGFLWPGSQIWTSC